MVAEHRSILGHVTALLERTKHPHAHTSGDLGQLSSQIALQIAEHESRELLLVASLS
jgi:hypothetical protein